MNTPNENQVLIMGCHCIEEILKHDAKRILKAYCVKASDETSERKTKILKELQSKRIEIEHLSPSKLDALCGSKSHQGFVAALKKRERVDLKQFLAKSRESSLVLALDSIYDPHNLGAILRAAECFDVDLVVWSRNRGAKLTPVVTKSSSSASELVPIHILSNLSTAIRLFIKEGYEVVIAHLGPNSESLFEFEFAQKTLLILGSEGEGVRSILQKQAHHALQIPMHGKIDSLNVSQAAALFLGFWKNQIKKDST